MGTQITINQRNGAAHIEPTRTSTMDVQLGFKYASELQSVQHQEYS